ncbi:MAG TPA: polyphosphate kinase 1 [Acidobacteriaceae bacterium]|nr:polyphosphate kinase 1 [Acidobacteriaceae bacterium]
MAETQPTSDKPSASRKRPAVRRKTAPGTAAFPQGRYFNRDESWLLFNQRVLEEAEDATNPLLERVKFLAITSSNLDEFLEIRVAGILQLIEEGRTLPATADEGGLTQEERLTNMRRKLHDFAAKQAACWTDKIEPALAEADIRVVRWKNLRKSERLFATRFFVEQIDPLLTPVTLDPSHPFPRVLNKAIGLALLLRVKRKTHPRAPYTLGIVTIPRTLPSLLALPEHKGQRHFLPLDELIEAHADKMFRGYRVLSRAAFRVTRNSNLYMQEEEARSLLESVREELHNRRKGDAVRLEIDASAAEEITERLRTNFDLDRWQVFPTEAPVNLSRLMDLYSAVDRKDLKFPEFHGRKLTLSPESANIFDELRRGDILLHHPFDTYNTVETFIQAGQTDEQVISLKQTLYRTSANSTIFRALKDAAQSKETTVVVELMARFDEASNIRWARELEDAGVQVFHGIFGQKTHCKLALIARRDSDGAIRFYAHLGTGNYNPVTARFYTDISLLTARPEITLAVQNVFRYLTAEWQAQPGAYRPLLVSPVTLAKDTLALIARETEHARAGRPAHIIAKMNALLDGPTIEALYAASAAGVSIDLIVRGMCALRPQVPGLSEHIRVRSIVGRFLEHSRIFWFENGGAPEVYAGSADWMPRNLYERCEVLFPVRNPAAATRLREEILEAYLRDNKKVRFLEADGQYNRPPRPRAGTRSLSAQDWLMEQSKAQELRSLPNLEGA